MTNVLIVAAVLLFLNIYSANTTRDMMLRTKAASLQGKTQLVVSSLSGLENLNTDNVTQVINLLGDLGATRVAVTNGEGRALYDSLTRGSAAGKFLILPEVVQALDGNDVFHCVYDSAAGALESHACMPILYYDSPIGAVYMMEYDTVQGAVIAALEANLIRITVPFHGVFPGVLPPDAADHALDPAAAGGRVQPPH